jgi:hypothetical protein
MVKSEMMKLLAVISEVYPKFEVSDVKAAIFYELLGDMDYITLQTAIKKHMLISEYPPTIAELRKLATEIQNPTLQLTAADAWGEVEKAIRHFGWYRGEEALASMSEGARKIAQYIGWQNICEAENLDVVRGQFFKMFGQVELREKTEALLPETVRKDIERLAEKLSNKVPLLEVGGDTPIDDRLR